jgi:thiol-disulfide isomerase/thioredoxin
MPESFRKRPIFALLILLTFAVGPLIADDEFYTLTAGTSRPEMDFRLLDAPSAPPLDWSNLEGGITVLDFWATWCAPCVAAFPKFNELEKNFADQPVRFISITYETPEMILPFLAKHRLETQVALDNDFATFRSFKAWGIPAVYIFDRQGELLSVVHPEDLNRELIAGAIAGKVPEVSQSRGWEDPAGAEEYFRSLVEQSSE